MIAFRNVLAALFLATFSGAAWAQGSPLPPPGYVYQPAPACIEDPVKAVKPLRPGAAVYRLCDDQMAYLAQSIAEAGREGKLLIVTVGATWCPWCAALQRSIGGPEFFAHKGGKVDYSASFRHIEIGLSMTHKGRNAIVPSGDAVVKLLLARSGEGAKLDAIPFIFIVDPARPDRVFARNTKDLSDFATGRQDMAGFRRAIDEGYATLRGQKS